MIAAIVERICDHHITVSKSIICKVYEVVTNVFVSSSNWVDIGAEVHSQPRLCLVTSLHMIVPDMLIANQGSTRTIY